MVFPKFHCFSVRKVASDHFGAILFVLKPYFYSSRITYKMSDNVLQLGVRFLACRMFQVTTKLNSQKLTLRCCYSQ